MKYNGPKSDLEDFVEEITELLIENPPSTAAEANSQIAKCTGIIRSLSGIIRLMKRLGMKPQKVCHVPAKADPAAQENFIRKILKPLERKALSGKSVLMFCHGKILPGGSKLRPFGF